MRKSPLALLLGSLFLCYGVVFTILTFSAEKSIVPLTVKIDPKLTIRTGNIIEGRVAFSFASISRRSNSVGYFFRQQGECWQRTACASTLPGGKSANKERTTLELQWKNPVVNGDGADVVVYESGYKNGPEAFAVAFKEVTSDTFTDYRYAFASFYLEKEQLFITKFDLSDFGISKEKKIGAIRIRNLFNHNSSKWGDKVDSPTGQGKVLFEGSVGIGHFPTAGPLAQFQLYQKDKLDADILLVAGVKRDQ